MPNAALTPQIQSNRARGYPDWYVDENANPAPAASTSPATPPANANAPLPAWYRPESPNDGDTFDPHPPQAPVSSGPTVLPDNVKLDGVAPPGVPGAGRPQPTVLRDNVVLDGVAPEGVTVTATRPSETFGEQLGDFAANVGTGVARIPGAIVGVPHMLNHTLNWLQAKVQNLGDGGDRTGADIDKTDPLTQHTLSSEDVDNGVFKGISAVAGHEVHPYEPSSFIGKLLQAGITGAGAGVIDPAALLGAFRGGASGLEALKGATEGMAGRVAKTAIAADGANASQQAFPDEPGLAALAALVAHTGASAAETAARAGGGVGADAIRQVFSPADQGETEAGRALLPVDNTLPGIASPTPADIATRTGDVRAATEAIGPGLPDHMAGAQLRAELQQRSDALRTARTQAGDAAYDGFRAQPALPSAALEPLMRSPGFRKAVSAANAAVLDEGGDPMTGYWDFNAAGDPVLKPDAAIPPDVLGRVKSWTAAAAANAPAASAEARTAGILDKRVGDFLDQKYSATADFPGYAAVRQAYADAGKPLGDFAGGPVEKTLDADKQFGQKRYTLADERVPDLFLRSNATRADLTQLVAAHGGDKAAALGALQDHLAGIAQRAVQPDGTLDTAAFDKAMKPYQKSLGNLGMYFPELARKFANAKAAQGTLDTMQAQRGLADAVGNGALRDKDGIVTGASFGKWLRSSQDAISKTQSPGAALRLQSIASALQNTHPGELADVLKSEWAPTAIGMATGGLEGGVLGTLLHKSTQTAFGGLDAKRMAAFSAAIEKATLDPVYASRLAATAAKRGGGVSPVRGLVRAIAATPLAVNAGTAPAAAD